MPKDQQMLGAIAQTFSHLSICAPLHQYNPSISHELVNLNLTRLSPYPRCSNRVAAAAADPTLAENIDL
jgi:hypothetical protein